MSGAGAENMLDNALESYSRQELYNARYQNLGITPAKMQKIPAVLHHIWLTDPEKPQEISAGTIEQTKNTIALFANDDVNHWKFILWTNFLDALPTTRAALEPLGVNFCDIADLSLSEKASANIQYVINKHYWGMGSDALRYIIIQEQGGFYADLGAEFHRAPGLDLYRYDFLANQWEGYLNANNFFAAKANHPALIKTNKIVEDNLFTLRLDGEAFAFYSIKDLTTDRTAEPFNMGFYNHFMSNVGNSSGTVDVIIPHSQFHNHKNLYFDGIDPNIPQQSSLFDKYKPFDICAAEHVFIGQDPLPGESWYSRTIDEA